MAGAPKVAALVMDHVVGVGDQCWRSRVGLSVDPSLITVGFSTSQQQLIYGRFLLAHPAGRNRETLDGRRIAIDWLVANSR
jgi:hypothetical protein